MPTSRPQIQDITAGIVDGIVDGVVVTDAEGRILVWNRAAEEITGTAAADAVGKPAGALFTDNPAVVSQIEKTVSSGRSYSDYEAEFVVKNGPALPVGLVTSALLDTEGDPVGVILTIRDQSSVRELKDRMRRSDRLAAIGMIAAGIAHEIKNPLVGVRGAAQLLKSELRSVCDPVPDAGRNLTEYLDVILKEADRLNKVLEGILDFTRLKPREMKGSNIHSILD